jgi:Peptidase family M23
MRATDSLIKLHLNPFRRGGLLICEYVSIILFFSFQSFSQKQYPQNYFSSPLTIPLILSGNFGEIRGNHFHSGLDFKTQNKEGFPVVAAADGYVYRIKVSESGFGNALYLQHANGYETVYAHLYSFEKKIADTVLAVQYNKKKFEVELFPANDFFRFKRGDTIGYSGNTGGSAGPHLHFEIRDSIKDKPINPLLFGLNVTDTIAPVIKNLFVYNAQHQYPPQRFAVKSLDNKNYFIDEVVEAASSFYLGFAADDFAVTDSNNLGNYEAMLVAGDDTVYRYTFNSFAFDETKYVNSHIDFEHRYLTGETIEKCFLLPNNKLPVYDFSKAGKINNRKNIAVKLLLSDYRGNKSELNFNVSSSTKILNKPNSGKLYLWDKQNIISGKGFSLTIPSESFYENMFLQSATKSRIKNKDVLGEIINLSGTPIPLNKPATLTINKPGVGERLQKKLCIVSLDKENKLNYIGGTYEKGKVIAKINKLTEYAIAIDTIAPEISNAQLFTDSICNCKKIRMMVNDNLSGIRDYNAYLNGQWILMAYDPKTSNFVIDAAAIANNSTLVIEATDKRGNKGIREEQFNF